MTTRTEQQKEVDELDTFRDFARVSGVSVELTSVQKRVPPEPDILCTIVGEGPVAFELVEVCDRNLAQFMATVTEGGAYYMRTADPSANIMRKKLRREYRTEHPIELLCYTAGRVVTPANVILPTLRPYLASWKHVFRRAWLFNNNVAHVSWSDG